jgi:hypothetical protein
MVHEPGQKSWGEGRGLGNFLGGWRGQTFLNILMQICDNPERSHKFSENLHFSGKKVKHIFKNAICFFNLLCKILGGGRLEFNS